MAVNNSNVYSLVYNGTGIPSVKATVITGLTTGTEYNFKVSAINFNGEG
jgi:hypothetical protein